MAPPIQWREYLLATTFGYSPTEIDEQPAARLDWLLACHGIVESVQDKKQKEAQQ